MSLLARHKKPGGFENLVQFLETTPSEKRQKLIELMTQEDPLFMDRVVRSLLTLDDLKNLKDELIMEILHDFPSMRALALAFYKLEDKALIEKFTRCLVPKQFAEYREACEELDAVTKAQREGAQLKIVEHARKVELAKNLRIKPMLAA